MKTILPIISVSELQRSTKRALENVKDYAVVQSHGKDVAVVLSPKLGHVLLQSDNLRDLLCSIQNNSDALASKLDQMIGNVIHELSKK